MRLEIDAPPRIAPGDSVQLTATLVKSDGSRENASGRVGWISDSASTVAVSPTGLPRALVPGEATVSAVFESFSVQVRILVLPPGTFKLSGVITGGGLGIGNVAVRVLSDAGEGLTANTTPDGLYALYGVAGRVQVNIKRHGFVDRFAEIDVSDHRTFDVRLDSDPSTTSGIWTLTITAGPCNSGEWTLPAAARARTYTVLIVEELGPRASMEATLSDADFVIVDGTGHRFRGFRDIDRDNVRISFLELSDADSFPAGYEIFERLGPDSGLAIVGQLDTLRTPSAIEGAFAGSFLLIRNPPHGPVEARCDSPAHDFEMRRR